MNHDPTDLIDIFKHLGDLKGPIGLVASSIFLLIRLYRLPDWQDSLPPGARWESLTVVTKYGIIGMLALSGSLLASASNGLTWQEALTSGMMAIIAAITANKITKTPPVRAVAQLVVPPKAAIRHGQ